MRLVGSSHLVALLERCERRRSAADQGFRLSVPELPSLRAVRPM